MLTTGTPTPANIASELAPYERWAQHACDSAMQSFESDRMAAAAAVLAAGRRTRLTGSGIGLDVARFGAQALRESGVDASAEHAHDLATFPSRFEPGETVIGIDTDAREVGVALRRARALGIRTIALTDRDLTLVGADVLLPHPGLSAGGTLMASPLAACFVLALLSARLEPGSGIAREVAQLPRLLEGLASTRATAAQFTRDLRTPGRRLIVAGAGSTQWLAESVARRVNGLSGTGFIPPAHAIHAADLRSPGWTCRPDDALILIEPSDFVETLSPEHARARRSHAATTWRIGGARTGAAQFTRLPLESHSPALSSIYTLYVLEQLILELASA